MRYTIIPRDAIVNVYVYTYAIYFYDLADDKLFMLLLYLSLKSDYVLAPQILCLNCSEEPVYPIM